MRPNSKIGEQSPNICKKCDYRYTPYCKNCNKVPDEYKQNCLSNFVAPSDRYQVHKPGYDNKVPGWSSEPNHIIANNKPNGDIILFLNCDVSVKKSYVFNFQFTSGEYNREISIGDMVKVFYIDPNNNYLFCMVQGKLIDYNEQFGVITVDYSEQCNKAEEEILISNIRFITNDLSEESPFKNVNTVDPERNIDDYAPVNIKDESDDENHIHKHHHHHKENLIINTKPKIDELDDYAKPVIGGEQLNTIKVIKPTVIE